MTEYLGVVPSGRLITSSFVAGSNCQVGSVEALAGRCPICVETAAATARLRVSDLLANNRDARELTVNFCKSAQNFWYGMAA